MEAGAGAGAITAGSSCAPRFRMQVTEEDRSVGYCPVTRARARRRPVPCRRRGDPHARRALLHLERAPGPERPRAHEPHPAQPAHRLRRREDRQRLVEPLRHPPVEVVLVQVREHHEVDGGQRLEVEGRLGEALGREPVAEVYVVARVQEIRIGQDGEARVPQDHGRRADEEDGARHGRSGRTRRQNETVGLPHGEERCALGRTVKPTYAGRSRRVDLAASRAI
jgi:hypothetical protein